MKKLNIFLLVVLILLLSFVAYYFIGGTLIAKANTITAPAADHPDAFHSICGVISSGAAPQQFVGSVPQNPDDYTLIDVTVTLTNFGLFPAEWLHIAVEPLPGDVAVYSLTGEGDDIPRHSSSQINLKLISTEPADASRTVSVSYYVFGMLRSVEITC